MKRPDALTPVERAALTAARAFMRDGTVTPRERAMIATIGEEERTAGYPIPASEVRDLMAYASGHLSRNAEIDGLRDALRHLLAPDCTEDTCPRCAHAESLVDGAA